MQQNFGISRNGIKGVCHFPSSRVNGKYIVWAQQSNGRVAMYIVNTDVLSGKLADPTSSLDTYELLMKVFSLGS